MSSSEPQSAYPLRNFQFPGKKICIGCLLAGVIMILINRHGTEIPALMWSGFSLILGGGIYMLYWAIRSRNRAATIRVAISLVFVVVMMVAIGILNSIIGGAESTAATGASGANPSESSQLPVYMSFAMLGLPALVMFASGIIGCYYYFRHDQQGLAKWRVRNRWVIYGCMAVILVSVAILIFAI